MGIPLNIKAYSDALIVLGTAGIVIPVVRRWGINPILGYLFAGAILGPYGLGSLAITIPALTWITITDVRSVSGIAELGVVFLLFMVGLELSLERLLNIRRLVFGLGGLQIAISTSLISAAGVLLGQSPAIAIIIGASLSLSSTAIVLETLSGQQRLSSAVGRTSFAILLAQDLAVVPLLLFIGMLHSTSNGGAAWDMLLALGEAAAGLAFLAVFGRKLLRPLFHIVAETHSTDLFIAATFFTIVGSAVVAHLAGLSMALGGFIAGLLLAETEYRKAVQAIIDPFKSLLLGIFFFTIGMKVDVREIILNPLYLVAIVSGVILLKSVIIAVLGRLFGQSWRVSAETGLLLGPCGEFAFVSIGVAGTMALIGSGASGLILTAASITMVMLPALSAAAHRLTAAGAAGQLEPIPRLPHSQLRPQALVIGYGRVGEMVCNFLRKHGITHVIIDNDPVIVARARHHGHDVCYGDAAHEDFLAACGIRQASGVVIAVGGPQSIDHIVSRIRSIRPDIRIFARVHNLEQARRLHTEGVDEMVHETMEASLQLSELALVQFGIPVQTAAASVQNARLKFRAELQSASGNLQREMEIRSV